MNNKKSYRFLFGIALFVILAGWLWRAQTSAADPHDEPLATATPTASATPTITNTPKPPATPSPTPTATATATVTATPTSTATATPDTYFNFLPALVDQPPPSPNGCEPSSHIPAYAPDTERELAEVLNAYRQANGEARLNVIPQLTQAARRHAWDMAANEFAGHTGSDDSTAAQRISDACYDWVNVGEMLGVNRSVSAMFRAWSRSESNRELLLSPDLHDFGVAYIYKEGSMNDHYWAVVLGRPASAGALIYEED